MEYGSNIDVIISSALNRLLVDVMKFSSIVVCLSPLAVHKTGRSYHTYIMFLMETEHVSKLENV